MLTLAGLALAHGLLSGDPVAAGRQAGEAGTAASLAVDMAQTESAAPPQTGSADVRSEEPQPNGTLVVVRARRQSSVFATADIAQLELLTDPSANADPLLSVAALPGATNTDTSAELRLRGSSRGIDRVYFNDIPLYELVRGADLDTTTRVASVLNAGLIGSLEVYPSNSPIYLANAGGGAVRLLPTESANPVSTAYIGVQGLSVSSGVALAEGSFAQGFASAIDLTGLLGLNPDLKESTQAYRSLGLGGTASLNLDEETQTLALAIADTERGDYRLRILDASGLLESQRSRVYLASSVERRLGVGRLKLDAAYSVIDGTSRYNAYRSSTRNSYSYVSLDMSWGQDRWNYRVGIASEQARFRINGSLAYFSPDAGPLPTGTDTASSNTTAAYLFATFAPDSRRTLAFGLRAFLASDPTQDPVVSLAYTAMSRNRRHKVIASVGSYSAWLAPSLDAFGPTRSMHSRQAALDYSYRAGDLALRVGVYRKTEAFNEREIDIWGFDVGASLDVNDRLQLDLVLASVDSREGGVATDADLPVSLKLAATVIVSPSLRVTSRFTFRSGQVYTRVIDTIPLPSGGVAPLFSPSGNDARLGPFRSLDVSASYQLSDRDGAPASLLVFGVTNLLDQDNPARRTYTPGFLREETVFSEGRTWTVGIVLPF